MKSVLDFVRKTIITAGLLGVLTGCNESKQQTRQTFPNSLTFTHHYGYDKFTDSDFDGKIDIREQVVTGAGGFRKLYFERGYGPERSNEGQSEYVDQSYFDGINEIFQKSMLDFAYGRSER